MTVLLAVGYNMRRASGSAIEWALGSAVGHTVGPSVGRMPGYALGRGLAWIPVACSLSACATTRTGASWGENATLTPSGTQLGRAAAEAVRDPFTWGPLLGALVLQIDDLDTRISEYARDERPCFGSRDRAANASDYFRDGMVGVYVVSALATPSGETTTTWLTNKARGVTVGVAARAVTFGVVDLLKAQTDRVRPDRSNDRSFPSGHASGTATMAVLAERNVDALSPAPAVDRAVDAALVTIVSATSWARIEAAKHYPSDTLVGAALGNFFGAFVNDAFLRTDHADATFWIAPSGGSIRLVWRF